MQLKTPLASGIDVEEIRKDFPIYAFHKANGKKLHFLDSAASAQKPAAMIEAMRDFAYSSYANVHRGVYQLSADATQSYEDARAKTADFVNAKSADEVVFTHSATEAFNLIAHSFCQVLSDQGAKVIAVSQMEHHSNFIPWQVAAKRWGLKLEVIGLEDNGELSRSSLDKVLAMRPALVSLSHVSNVTGVKNPLAELIPLIKAAGARVVIDGAQAAPHLSIDVQALDCDFYVFTGHKVYGPTGIGALYARQELLASMPPFMTGGGMIERVSLQDSEWAAAPARFEAGTPPILEAIGLAAAIDYLQAIGLNKVAAHDAWLCALAAEKLAKIDKVKLIGANLPDRASAVSFVVDGIHSHDVGTFLDAQGVQVRVGHHCAKPLMDHFGISGTVRASFGIYNAADDVDALVESLHNTIEKL